APVGPAERPRRDKELAAVLVGNAAAGKVALRGHRSHLRRQEVRREARERVGPVHPFMKAKASTFAARQRAGEALHAAEELEVVEANLGARQQAARRALPAVAAIVAPVAAAGIAAKRAGMLVRIADDRAPFFHHD